MNRILYDMQDDIQELHTRLAKEIEARKKLEAELREVRDAAFLSTGSVWTYSIDTGPIRKSTEVAVSTVMADVLKHLKVELIRHPGKAPYVEMKTPRAFYKRLLRLKC